MSVRRGLVLGAAVLMVGAAAAGAAAAYYWNRATTLPTWYTTSGADSDIAASLSSSSNVLQTKLASGEGVEYLSEGQVAITLSEVELNQLIQEGLSQSAGAAPLLQASRGVKATIEGNRLQAGAVVNPANLPLDQLPAETQQTVQQALETLPMLRERDLYVGITGSPRVENGRLVLGNDTRVQIGTVQLSLAEVARLTGMNPAQLTEHINIALPQAGLTLDGLEFVNGEAILRGTQD